METQLNLFSDYNLKFGKKHLDLNFMKESYIGHAIARINSLGKWI